MIDATTTLFDFGGESLPGVIWSSPLRNAIVPMAVMLCYLRLTLTTAVDDCGCTQRLFYLGCEFISKCEVTK